MGVSVVMRLLLVLRLDLAPFDHEKEDVGDTNISSTDNACVQKLEPVIGMEFDNEDIAYEFYNRYAGDVGFSIRKFWHDKSSTNVIRTKKFVCSREGFNKRNTSDACQRKRADTRVGCMAEMTIKITPTGKYAIASFSNTHNHELITPSKAHLLRSQRRMTEAQKAQIDILNDSGVRPKEGHEVMSRQADFFKHFERAVDDRRHAELQSDFYASQTSPRMPKVHMLIQASKAYTPAIFEIFREEYDMVMGCCLYNNDHTLSTSEYKVIDSAKHGEHGFLVKFDPNEIKVSCSCKKFEFVGILCRHALKVLDHNNIKELPSEYILKRWTKYAKIGSS
ncbi:hypothetical protein OsI_23236 [Oryza sativa Indica Group]|uniref:SWIM-type domain-containing protein n=1 Tax=Oryza sativa subsp. indica TaxID=39946 RepID=A2YDQ0_ORYSI|nr:hypothetical protein OsI_23236 [Oryza sativa Indica Group]